MHYGIVKKFMRKIFSKLAAVLANDKSYLMLNPKNEYVVAQYTKAEYAALPAHLRSLRTRTLGFNTSLSARTVIQWSEYTWKRHVHLQHTIEAARRSGILPFNPAIVLAKFEVVKKPTGADARASVRMLEQKSVQDFELVCASNSAPSEKLERFKQLVKELPDFSQAMHDGNILMISGSLSGSHIFLLLFLEIAASSAAPMPIKVAPPAVPETKEEEAKRIVHNIMHNKAFVNLDMRALKGRQLDALVLERFTVEWAKLQKQREKAGRAAVPISKVKKAKKEATSEVTLPSRKKTKKEAKSEVTFPSTLPSTPLLPHLPALYMLCRLKIP